MEKQGYYISKFKILIILSSFIGYQLLIFMLKALTVVEDLTTTGTKKNILMNNTASELPILKKV